MKSLLFVCTVLVANGIAANVNRQDKVINQILHKVPKINEYFTECIIQTKISEDDAENVTLLPEAEDRIANKLTHCLYRKTGILGNDGKLNVGAARSILTLIGVEQDEVNKIVNKCSVEHSSEGLHQERQETPTSDPQNLSPWAIAPSRDCPRCS